MFAKNNAMDETVVLVMSNLRKRIKNSDLKRNEDETMVLEINRVKSTIERVIKANEKYLPATYRQKNRQTFINEVYEYILQLGFGQEKDGQVIFYPIIGKMVGSYEEE